MRNILLAFASATTLAMTEPADAQSYLYLGMPSGAAGTPSSGRYGSDDGQWRSNNWRETGGDWRQHRNDWRENNANDWRRDRNAWHDADDWRPYNQRIEDGTRDQARKDKLRREQAISDQTKKEGGKDNVKDYVIDNAKNNPYVDERYVTPVPARP
jgi:hypothetical protein